MSNIKVNESAFVPFSPFFNKKRKNDFELRYEALLHDIEKAKLELDTAVANFNIVSDPDLVDLWTYQIKSAQTKYGHLIQKAKNFV